MRYVQKVTFDSYLYKTVQGNDPVGDLKLGLLADFRCLGHGGHGPCRSGNPKHPGTQAGRRSAPCTSTTIRKPLILCEHWPEQFCTLHGGSSKVCSFVAAQSDPSMHALVPGP